VDEAVQAARLQLALLDLEDSRDATFLLGHLAVNAPHEVLAAIEALINEAHDEDHTR
jgi:hypothetical protein